jgi:hypothetical protein
VAAAVAEVTPVQQPGKVRPEIVVKLQLAPTKDNQVPANMVTVVVQAAVVVVGEAATEAQYPAAIKVVLPVCMAAVQELVKIHLDAFLAEPTVHTIPAALRWVAA